jgi:peroxiredoxin Q/BCP
MSMPNIGDPAPDFTLPGDGGQTIRLADYRGKHVILYFYPKDDTPGCTKEAIGFSEQRDALDALDAVVIGMSKDTPAKHDKFIAKHDLKVSLASDEAGSVLDDYGVWVEKSMYGKTYMGIQRATFLIGPDGAVLQVWPKVRVKGHVEAVMEALRQAKAA